MFVTLALMLLWTELTSDLAAKLPVEILIRVVSVGYERQLSAFAEEFRNCSKHSTERSTHQWYPTTSLNSKYKCICAFASCFKRAIHNFLQKRVV